MSESQETYDPSTYPPFAVTVDVVALTVRDGRLSAVLVERGREPFDGAWALPGGFVHADEDLGDAALRELAEETALAVDDTEHLEQLASFGAPDRDPRMRVVTVAHLAIIPDPGPLEAGTDAAGARWFAVDDLDLGDGGDVELAFDHAAIVTAALERVRSKLEHTTLATHFCDDEFTLGELRRVYETVWGTELHASNFARKVTSTPGFVEPVDGTKPTGGRPAPLYRAGQGAALDPPLMRPEEHR